MSDSDVYQVPGLEGADTLHEVVTCDLSVPKFTCRARGILGGPSRTFFASRNAVYVWVSPSWMEWNEQERAAVDQSRHPSHLFRLPLDGAKPSALEVRGMPVDQFSFHETEENLFVVVRTGGEGDAMWAPELPADALGIVRVPLSAFGPDVRALSRDAYRTLAWNAAKPSVQNRFVGNYLLYGTGDSWGWPEPAPTSDRRVFLHRFEDGRTFVATLPGSVDRIEAMADDAVVIGTDGQDLHFSAFALDPTPVAGGRYAARGASQGETRSHGFFYKPTKDREGILGLPTATAGRPGFAQLGPA